MFKRLGLLLAVAVTSQIQATVATGSGFAIAKRQVLTAYHVVDKATRIKVEFSDGSSSTAMIEKKSVLHDWALLRLEKESPAVATCSAKPIKLGDKIYTLGYPTASILGKSVKYAEGTVSALTGLGSDTNSFQYSVPIQPGNSGGPIFNNNGLVVGIVQATINPEMYFSRTGGALPQAINFGLQIRSLLSEFGGIVHDGANRSIDQNQSCTCFITADAPDRTDKPTGRNSPPKTSSAPSINSQPATLPREKQFEDGVVSDRYRQLAGYLTRITEGKFTTLEGAVIDILQQDGYICILNNIDIAKSALKVETLRMIFMHTTDLPQTTIDQYTEKLHGKAQDAIRVYRARNLVGEGNFGNFEFFGLKLGCKVDVTPHQSITGTFLGLDVLIDGITSCEYSSVIGCNKRGYYLNREDWPAITYSCFRYNPTKKDQYGMKAKMNFLDSNQFMLICSESKTLVGIVWHRKFPTTTARELVQFLEKKYSINFGKTLPKKFSIGDAPPKFGFRDNVFSYIGRKVEIYVTCGWRGWDAEAEELHILLPEFEKILQEDRIKEESTNRTDSSVNISGGDTL